MVADKTWTENARSVPGSSGELPNDGVVAMLSTNGAKQTSKQKEDCHPSGRLLSVRTMASVRSELETLVNVQLNTSSLPGGPESAVSSIATVKLWAAAPPQTQLIATATHNVDSRFTLCPPSGSASLLVKSRRGAQNTSRDAPASSLALAKQQHFLRCSEFPGSHCVKICSR